MKFTWSQYEAITTCDCSGCSFQKQGGLFISHCESCSCDDPPATSTKCIPGFFTIRDRGNITNWEEAGNFFEINMCVVRGRHPPAMCRKMRCEVFGSKATAVDDGGEFCANSSTWISTHGPLD